MLMTFSMFLIPEIDLYLPGLAELWFSFWARTRFRIRLTRVDLPEPETPEETAEPEEPAQKPAGLNPALLLAVLALLGGGGAFAYFKFIRNKPKTKGNDNLDDYDYGEDDTDQEDEDPWETEESDEPDADGGGDEESEDKAD